MAASTSSKPVLWKMTWPIFIELLLQMLVGNIDQIMLSHFNATAVAAVNAQIYESAGYVAAGSKSATKQLTAQAAQTITPGATDKTIAAGRYLTGVQTIKAAPLQIIFPPAQTAP